MRDKLFISYRRADAAQAAGRIRDSLDQEFPQRVFVDVEDIQFGDDFLAVIGANLESAAALLVVIGPRWLDGSSTGTGLGDPGDYVGIELQTALRLGVPLLPILIDGATMPREADIPVAFGSLLRCNALQIRHASFHRDLPPLVAYAYRALRLTPPTLLEQSMEKLAGKFGYGRRFRYDEKMRDYHARTAIFFGVALLAWAVGSLAWDVRPDADAILLAVSVLYVALIGKNSSRHGRRARVALVLTLIAAAIGMVQAVRLS